MSLMREYIDRRLSGPELESELLKLIALYNRLRNTYLFVYAAAIGKAVPFLPLEQADFYVFRDLLAAKKGSPSVDVYLQTPGGSGETAEEIVRFLHESFDTVSFVVSAEAKSAGTIMVLSGDEILMTETGSLGPIDAQVKIGRSVQSAYDYIEWVQDKRKEAEEQGRLNPFDATMVAQITPGELGSVLHAMNFAKDLVIQWLTEYKFRKWVVTETRKMPVTGEMRRKRAGEIADELANHSKWRLHGRSIKIHDLEQIGLKITRLDDNPELADLVYRIQTVSRLLFDNTTAFKIFATQDSKIFRQAILAGGPLMIPQKGAPNAVRIEQKCPACGAVHKIYGKLSADPKIDHDLKKEGFVPFPNDAKIVCKCGFEMDLSGIKNEIEMKVGKKLLTDQKG